MGVARAARGGTGRGLWRQLSPRPSAHSPPAAPDYVRALAWALAQCQYVHGELHLRVKALCAQDGRPGSPAVETTVQGGKKPISTHISHIAPSRASLMNHTCHPQAPEAGGLHACSVSGQHCVHAKARLYTHPYHMLPLLRVPPTNDTYPATCTRGRRTVCMQ